MSRSVDPKLVVSGLFSLVFIASAPAAFGASEDWYSRADSLKAIDDGVHQGYAYGTAYTKNSYLKNHTYWKDARPGGDGVYTQTDYSYFKERNGMPAAWGGREGKDQSSRSTSGTWRDQYDNDDYTEQPTASAGRVYYKVCEDQPSSPDACSRQPYITFNGL